eukprot:TRINITY_DN14833_c0_g1_i1.p1 TRINITY_DN14833_c0_g1~~TRINITY_DN14833_c0_g1_i1.p1  ORF type:complete len:874 (+),score=198.51 TRINITY_DN14833_c0_g1_i1:277-2622(+)
MADSTCAVFTWFDRGAGTGDNICELLSGCAKPGGALPPFDAALLCRKNCSAPPPGACVVETATPPPSASPTGAPLRPLDPSQESRIIVDVEVASSVRVRCIGSVDGSSCEQHGVGPGMLLTDGGDRAYVGVQLGACGQDACAAAGKPACTLACPATVKSPAATCGTLTQVYGDCAFAKEYWLDDSGKKARVELVRPSPCNTAQDDFMADVSPAAAVGNPCVYRAEFQEKPPYSLTVSFLHYYSSRQHPKFVADLVCPDLEQAEWRGTVTCSGLPFHIGGENASGIGDPPTVSGSLPEYAAPTMLGELQDIVHAETAGASQGTFVNPRWNRTHFLVDFELPADPPWPNQPQLPLGMVGGEFNFEYKLKSNELRTNRSKQVFQMPIGTSHDYTRLPPTNNSMLRCTGRNESETYHCSLWARDDVGGVLADVSDFVIRHRIPNLQCAEEDLVGPWPPHNVVPEASGGYINFTVTRKDTCVKALVFYVWVSLKGANEYDHVLSSDEWGNGVANTAQSPECDGVPGGCVGYMEINDAAPPRRKLYFAGDYDTVVRNREDAFKVACGKDPHVGVRCVDVDPGPEGGDLWGPGWIRVTVQDESARKVENAVESARAFGLFNGSAGSDTCWTCSPQDPPDQCCTLAWKGLPPTTPAPVTPYPTFPPNDGTSAAGLAVVGAIAAVIVLGLVLGIAIQRGRAKKYEVWTQFAGPADGGGDDVALEDLNGTRNRDTSYAAYEEGPTGGSSPQTRPPALSEGPSAGAAAPAKGAVSGHAVSADVDIDDVDVAN